MLKISIILDRGSSTPLFRNSMESLVRLYFIRREYLSNCLYGGSIYQIMSFISTIKKENYLVLRMYVKRCVFLKCFIRILL